MLRNKQRNAVVHMTTTTVVHAAPVLLNALVIFCSVEQILSSQRTAVH
jgi:hypothetical protein